MNVETIVCGGRQRMGTPEGPVVRTGQTRLLSTPSRRCQPQAILNEFEAAMEKAVRVCQLARGREVVGIAACVAKLVSAEGQKALHILAAADRAIAELQG
jgi:hypothetical protein